MPLDFVRVAKGLSRALPLVEISTVLGALKCADQFLPNPDSRMVDRVCVSWKLARPMGNVFQQCCSRCRKAFRPGRSRLLLSNQDLSRRQRVCGVQIPCVEF